MSDGKRRRIIPEGIDGPISLAHELVECVKHDDFGRFATLLDNKNPEDLVMLGICLCVESIATDEDRFEAMRFLTWTHNERQIRNN